MKRIEVDEVRTLNARPGTVLLEVLPLRYYEEGHLPGARQVTNDELPARAAELLPDRDAPIVVYCSGPSCGNSHRAGIDLARLGYRDVRVFAGGKAAWTEAGLALEVGRG